MPDTHQLDLTATQVNTAINNAHDSDREPASGQSTLCTGDKIASAIVSAVATESASRTDGDDALDVRITSLEGATVSEVASVYVFCDISDQLSTTGVLDLEGGTGHYITLSYNHPVTEDAGIYTLPAGTWTIQCLVQIDYNDPSDHDPSQQVYLRVNGANVVTLDITADTGTSNTKVSGSYSITSESTITVSFYWVEGENNKVSLSSISGQPLLSFFKTE